MSFGTWPTGTALNNAITLRYMDVNAWYTLLDSALTLDVGAGYRRFEVEMRLTNVADGTSAGASTSHSVPIVFGKASFTLPESHFSLNSDVSYYKSGEDKYLSNAMFVAWELTASLMVLSLETGYEKREWLVEDKGDLDVELKAGGLFVRLQGVF